MRTTPLGKLAYIKTGKLDVNAGAEDGQYPFFTCSVTPYKIHNYAFDNEAVLIAGNGDLNVKYYKGKFNAYQRTYVIQNKDKEILFMKYLYYFMETYMDHLRRGAIGGIIKYIKLGHLTNAEIPLPPLNDQIRIAHVLGKVEALIARRKHHLQQLDKLLKSVFLEMFGDPVRNEKGWDTLPFNKVGQFISGGTPSKSRDDFWVGSFPWVSPKDMKVSKIDDAIDHISETVFEETSLKRIAPEHLLIVVRGMILAHSFPVAINTVEIAINQDMKAIKPINSMNVIYLQNCLISLKFQILKLISTAAHGTRKFDSIAMQKLFIPIPPEGLQTQFATIAEKVEGIKTQYQQNLTNLENLYGVLSQKAFKGELDLNSVPLPKKQPVKETGIVKWFNDKKGFGFIEQGYGHDVFIHHTSINSEDFKLLNKESLISFDTDDNNSIKNIDNIVNKIATSPVDEFSIDSLEGRAKLLQKWFNEFIQKKNEKLMPLEAFWQQAQSQMQDYMQCGTENGEQQALGITIKDYDFLKEWVFEQIRSGRIEQNLNSISIGDEKELGNTIILKNA